ncbi:MAG: hypothetical protein OXE74_00410 [Cyanobacteria bacterium MAG CAR2_bin_4]|nr:hypothetical protein [Cyanobacteria bacterium MAG CAR2_bin_4]
MVDPGSGQGDRREITLPVYGAGLSASLPAGRAAGGATGCFERRGNVRGRPRCWRRVHRLPQGLRQCRTIGLFT